MDWMKLTKREEDGREGNEEIEERRVQREKEVTTQISLLSLSLDVLSRWRERGYFEQNLFILNTSNTWVNISM